ncbi:NUDIX hydrolase [Azospirillum melinis]
MPNPPDSPDTGASSIAWRTVRRRELLRRDPWLTVYEETVVLPDGRRIDDYHRMELQDTAVILAIDDQGRLLVQEGYRHGVGALCLALPGGALEPGEAPLDGGRRELMEETGLSAEHWRPLLTTVSHANYFGNRDHFFVATGLSRTAAPQSGDLEAVTLRFLDPAEVGRWLYSGPTQPLGCATGLLLYLRLVEGRPFGGDAPR